MLAAACGSGSSATVDAFASTCGHPGDTGNDMGVGKFCQTQADCSQTAAAGLCSIIGDSTTHFCTHTCTSTGSADQCGSDATCECNSSNQCGCTPNACLM